MPDVTIESLSPREIQVLRGVAAAKTNAQIAYDLQLSVETIKTYTVRLRAKIGARSKVALAVWASTHLPEEQPACGQR